MDWVVLPTWHEVAEQSCKVHGNRTESIYDALDLIMFAGVAITWLIILASQNVLSNNVASHKAL